MSDLEAAGKELDKAIESSLLDHKYGKERKYLVEAVSQDLINSFQPLLEEISANTEINKDEIRQAIFDATFSAIYAIYAKNV